MFAKSFLSYKVTGEEFDFDMETANYNNLGSTMNNLRFDPNADRNDLNFNCFIPFPQLSEEKEEPILLNGIVMYPIDVNDPMRLHRVLNNYYLNEKYLKEIYPGWPNNKSHFYNSIKDFIIAFAVLVMNNHGYNEKFINKFFSNLTLVKLVNGRSRKPLFNNTKFTDTEYAYTQFDLLKKLALQFMETNNSQVEFIKKLLYYFG